MIIFMSLKVVQEKYNILVLWPNVRNQSELWLRARLHQLRETEKVAEKGFYMMVHYVVIKFRNIFAWLFRFFEAHNHKLVALIRGEYQLNKRGKSSSYLNNIRQFRDHVRHH